MDYDLVSKHKDAINDLMEDITSWGDFFIACDECSKDVALAVRYFLIYYNYSAFDVGELGDEFKDKLDDDSCLMVISKLGNEDSIIDYVKTAKSRNVKVYSICGDDKSDLALLADETIVLDGDFEKDLLIIKEVIIAVAISNSESFLNEIEEPHHGVVFR
jgi:D-arabinose 5-phosphate isomerase GutQ